MRKKKNDLELKYSVNALCLLEFTLNKRTVDIIQEMEAEGGASLHTLRAVLAAGLLWKDPMAKVAMASGGMLSMPRLNVEDAGVLIQSIGINNVSLTIGRTLGEFLRELGGEA